MHQNNYQKLLLSLLLLIIFTPNLFAGAKKDSIASYKDQSLKKGSWAIQVGIDNGFTVGPISGVDLMLKRHYTREKAFRFGIVDLDFSNSDLYNDDNNGYYGSQQDDLEYYNIGVIGQYLKYFKLNSTVLFYYTIGIRGSNYFFIATMMMVVTTKKSFGKSDL